MIKLTRFNGKDFYLNPELVQYIEETPDTVITLINHDKVVVKEKADDVVKKVIDYSRLIRSSIV